MMSCYLAVLSGSNCESELYWIEEGIGRSNEIESGLGLSGGDSDDE